MPRSVKSCQSVRAVVNHNFRCLYVCMYVGSHYMFRDKKLVSGHQTSAEFGRCILVFSRYLSLILLQRIAKFLRFIIPAQVARFNYILLLMYTKIEILITRVLVKKRFYDKKSTNSSHIGMVENVV